MAHHSPSEILRPLLGEPEEGDVYGINNGDHEEIIPCQATHGPAPEQSYSDIMRTELRINPSQDDINGRPTGFSREGGGHEQVFSPSPDLTPTREVAAAEQEEVQECLKQLKAKIKKNQLKRGIVISTTSREGHGADEELVSIHHGANKLLRLLKCKKYVCFSFHDLSATSYIALIKALSILTSEELPKSYKCIIFHYNGHGSYHSLLLKDGTVSRVLIIDSLSSLPLSKYLIFDCCSNYSTNDYNSISPCSGNSNNDDVYIIDAAPPAQKAYTIYDGYGVLTKAIIMLLKRQNSLSFAQFFSVHVPKEARKLINEVNKRRREEGLEDINMTPMVRGSLREDALVHGRICEHFQMKASAFCESLSWCQRTCCCISPVALAAILILFLAAFVYTFAAPVPEHDKNLITSGQVIYCAGERPESLPHWVRYDSYHFSFYGDPNLKVKVVSIPHNNINPLTRVIDDSYFYDPKYPEFIQVTDGIHQKYIPINSYNNPVYFLPGSNVTFDFSIVNGTFRDLFSACVCVSVDDSSSNKFINTGHVSPSVKCFSVTDIIKQKDADNSFHYRVEFPGYRFFVLQTHTYGEMVFNTFKAEWKYLDESEHAYLAYKKQTLSESNPIAVTPKSGHVLLCKLEKPQGIGPHYGYYRVRLHLRPESAVTVPSLLLLAFVVLLLMCLYFLYLFYTFNGH